MAAAKKKVASKKPSTEEMKALLASLKWATLNAYLRESTDEEVILAMYEIERSGEKRFRFVDRLYSRYSKLRRDRERREALASIAP
jgi:hypothetical protein